MAEGWLRTLGGPECEVFSAVTNPTRINPLAVEAMNEVGVDITTQLSESVDRYVADSLTSLSRCATTQKKAARCSPVRTRWFHRGFDDPADAMGSTEDRMAFFRRVRDEIKDRISRYLSDET